MPEKIHAGCLVVRSPRSTSDTPDGPTIDFYNFPRGCCQDLLNEMSGIDRRRAPSLSIDNIVECLQRGSRRQQLLSATASLDRITNLRIPRQDPTGKEQSFLRQINRGVWMVAQDPAHIARLQSRSYSTADGPTSISR